MGVLRRFAGRFAVFLQSLPPSWCRFGRDSIRLHAAVGIIQELSDELARMQFGSASEETMLDDVEVNFDRRICRDPGQTR